MVTTIRIILSSILLYFVYFETGIATTIAIGLLIINAELTGYIFSVQRKNAALDKLLSKLQTEVSEIGNSTHNSKSS